MTRMSRLIAGFAVLALATGSLSLTLPASATSAMTLKFDSNLSSGRADVSVFPVGVTDPSFTINWGDGTVSGVLGAGLYSHTYSNPGIYTVSLSGTVPGFGVYLDDPDDRDTGQDSLIEVVSFGEVGLRSLRRAFSGAENLTSVPATLPTTVTDLSRAFEGATSFNQNIASWNVSNVTDMSGLFWEAIDFNQNIGTWNVSNVTTMHRMFMDARAFNQDIGSWNVSNVTTMENMFEAASSFNQNIGNWNVANVIDMDSVFEDALVFNQNIGNWNVGNVTTMDNMFEGALDFNQNISGWSTSSVLDMGDMFKETDAFNQDLSAWNVSNVLDMNDMFEDAVAFNQSVGDWDVRRVEEMDYMFSGSGLSRLNYDRTLIGWSELDWTAPFSAFRSLDVDVEYCAVSARQSLLDGFFASIDDEGLASVCPPRILSSSTITNGAINSSISISGSSFRSGLGASDFIIDFGTTGLTLGSAQFISATEVRLVFSGTANAGKITIQAKTSAYDPAASIASDPLELLIQGPSAGEVTAGAATAPAAQLAATGPINLSSVLALAVMFSALGVLLVRITRRNRFS